MQKQWLEAGRIVGTHGVRGEVKVEPWADEPAFLLDFEEVQLNGKLYAVEQSRVHKTQVLLKLKGVDTVEDASLLRGKIVSINRDDAQLEDGAVFIADLIGLPVFADGMEIGKITEVLTLPGNDVYVVKGEHEYMIPAVQEYVEPLNIEDGCVKVTLIEGMQTDAD